jgi:hypothetical protein
VQWQVFRTFYENSWALLCSVNLRNSTVTAELKGSLKHATIAGSLKSNLKQSKERLDRRGQAVNTLPKVAKQASVVCR